MSNPVELTYPVVYKKDDGSEETISELWFGRLKLKHMEILPEDFFSDGGKPDPSKLIKVLPKLVAAMTDLPPETTGEIDFEDLEKVAEAITGALDPSQGKTGEKPSGS